MCILSKCTLQAPVGAQNSRAQPSSGNPVLQPSTLSCSKGPQAIRGHAHAHMLLQHAHKSPPLETHPPMHVIVHVNIHTQATIQYKQRVTPRKCTMLCQQPGRVNASLPGQDMRTTQDLGLPSNRSALGRSTQHSDQLDLHTHVSRSVMLGGLSNTNNAISAAGRA